MNSAGQNLDHSLRNVGSGPKSPELNVLPLVVKGALNKT